MGLEDAFAELGIAAGASASEIRRAYLKRVKERSPETDPEGFQRAREAFEIARRRAAKDSAPPPAASQPIPLDASPSGAPREAPVGAARPGRSAGEFVRRGAYRDAAPLLQVELETADGEGADLTVPPSAIARVALELIRDHAPGSAARLVRALEAHVAVAGGELAAFHGQTASWVLARELVAVGKLVPLELRVSMAAAALGADPRATAQVLVDFENHEPSRATSVALALSVDAPMLASLWARFLDGPVQAPVHSPSRALSPPVKFLAIVGAIVLMGIRLAFMAEGTKPPPPEPSPPSLPTKDARDAELIRDALRSGDCKRAKQLFAAANVWSAEIKALGGDVVACTDR